MEKRQFSLEMKDTTKLNDILQIGFGLICIVVSIVLTIYLIKSASDKSTWIGIYFIAAFGIFQIWSGFGFARKFIEIDSDKIILRKNSFFRARKIPASEIEKIESFPLNTIFRLKNKSRVNLQYGINYPERIEAIVNQLFLFAEKNKIVFENIEEIV